MWRLVRRLYRLPLFFSSSLPLLSSGGPPVSGACHQHRLGTVPQLFRRLTGKQAGKGAPSSLKPLPRGPCEPHFVPRVIRRGTEPCLFVSCLPT
ncbi:hypothetical protein LZ30DRAFT_716109 [Colletotrichum cereale]|nr:hypothetical protein LZ30DRAFT_716109 [Colletotrichum cereale]